MDIEMKSAGFRFDPSELGPSGVALVVANLIPLIGVVVFGWALFPIMFLFWAENLVIGAYNIVRMVTCQPTEPLSWAVKVFMVPFFAFHYGMFCLVHGVFVIGFFGMAPDAATPGVPGDFGHRAVLEGVLLDQGIWLAIIAMIASHGVSLAVNWFGKGELHDMSPQEVMGLPYGRVVVLHLVIIGSGFLAVLVGQGVAAVALLVLVKSGIDLAAHQHEHAKLGAREPSSAGEPEAGA